MEISKEDIAKIIAKASKYDGEQERERLSKNHEETLGKLKEKDVNQILEWRPIFAWFSIGLLSIQAIVFWDFLICQGAEKLSDAKFATLVTGVLGETFGIMYVIVNYVFSKLDFDPVHKYKK